jgi:hypothetical protein
MSNIAQSRKALLVRILEGDDRASHAQRRAAFDNAGLAEPLSTLINKVAKHAHKVTEEDIAAARTRSSSSWCVRRSVRPRGSTIRRSRPWQAMDKPMIYD